MDEALRVCMRVLRDNLALQKGEVFLALSHSDHDGELAELFAACANSFGAFASTVKVVGSGRWKEPDKAVSAALRNADAVISIASINKTDAERAAREAGTRFIHCPFLRKDAFVRLMKADLAAISKKAHQFAEKMQSAEVLRMTSEIGTNFEVRIGGKPSFAHDGTAREKGTVGMIPPAQAETAPVSGTAKGTIVADGYARPWGVVSQPIKLQIRNGYIEDITGGREAKAIGDYLRAYEDKETFACPAHIGPGFNQMARLCDNILEAFSVEGHMVVGIGANTDLEGGDINAKGHTDVTLTNADVFLDDEQVIRKGRILM